MAMLNRQRTKSTLSTYEDGIDNRMCGNPAPSFAPTIGGCGVIVR